MWIKYKNALYNLDNCSKISKYYYTIILSYGGSSGGSDDRGDNYRNLEFNKSDQAEEVKKFIFDAINSKFDKILDLDIFLESKVKTFDDFLNNR